MPTGDFILATDYNNIRNKIVPVLGAGSATFGYGQSIQSSAVGAGVNVTKAQWDALRFDIYNCLFHQTGVVPSLVEVAVGQVVSFGAGQPNTQYDTRADTAVANRFALGTGQFITNFGVTSASRTDAWSSSVSCTVTANFNNANEARYFFNSGGQIRVTTSRSGGAATAQNSSWSSLLSSAGTQIFAGQIPNSGFSPMDGTNFYRLTNSFQTFYTVTASSPYASNRYSVQAACNVANNSTGTATQVQIRVVLDDPYVDPPVGIAPAFTGDIGPEDVVDGTLTVTVDQIRPSGTLQPSPAAGSFTVPVPTYSISAISGS